jgi:hypothetical protein
MTTFITTAVRTSNPTENKDSFVAAADDNEDDDAYYYYYYYYYYLTSFNLKGLNGG